MRKIRVGINGFGRIGRNFTRIALTRNSFDIAAINTKKSQASILAYLLTYDSIYRKFALEVTSDPENIIVNGQKIRSMQAPDIESIPWNEQKVDLVVDATGAFTKKADLLKHLKGAVKKVILTTPSEDDETAHVVLGVNEDKIDFKKEAIISNCSCTTNCAAPMFKVVDDNFKIVSGFLTTAHAYTSSQVLLDDPAKKFERSRAAALNIVPATTGAAKAVIKVLPNLEKKIDGMALRVPVPTGSFTDISAIVEKQTTIEEVNRVFKNASGAYLKNYLAYETAPIVSSDIIGSPFSCVFAANQTKVINGNLVKLFGWYDNEWGYSTRLVDLVEQMSDYI